MSDQRSQSHGHSQHSHRSNPSKKSDSSSDSSASRASRFAHLPEHHTPRQSASRGRTYRRHGPSGHHHSSRSSSSRCSEDGWPFSVRDIENLDPVINKHLDDMANMIATVDITQQNIDHYEDDMEDMNWQMFLFRTGACRARPGSEEEPWIQSPEGLVENWRHAAKHKSRALMYLEEQEHICAGGVSILFKLLSERNHRKHIAGGNRQEGNLDIA